MEATAFCCAQLSNAHHLRSQPARLAWRSAGGARGARTRSRSRTRSQHSAAQRPPISQARTTRRWGPGRRSSGYLSLFLRLAVTSAAPSSRAVRGCGWPFARSGETKVTSQQRAEPCRVAPYTTRSNLRRSSSRTPGAVVRASHCCGTTRPSPPRPSRQTRTQACSSRGARLARRPERAHAALWSPYGSTTAPQPGLPPPPHRRSASAKGRRSRRRSAVWKWSDAMVSAGSVGMAVSHAAAWGPDCDLRSAWQGGVRWGNNSLSR